MWFEDLTVAMLNRFLKAPTPPVPPGVLLGTTVGSPHRPVVFPDRHRTQHLIAIGKTGFGKTHALTQLVLGLAERDEGFAFFDFHGDASLSIVAHLSQRSDADARLVVLDPSHPTLSAALNVLESGPSDAERFRKVSEVSSILRQRWGVEAFGARTEELLRNSLYTLASTGGTLADLARLLTDSADRQRRTDALDHPEVQTYWRDRYEPLSDAMKGAFREPLLNKVTAFLADPAARHLFGQPERTVDLTRVMRDRQWLILRLPKGRLAEHAHTLGNLLFTQLQFAAFARDAMPAHERSRFTIVCDEVQNLVENDLAGLLSESRKFNICVVTANQFWEQLPKDFRGALLSAGSHLCFRVSHNDAAILAPELSLEHRTRLTVELTTLARGEALGRFGSQTVVRFRVPPLPRVPSLHIADLDRFIAPIARPRTEIEAAMRRGGRLDHVTPFTPGPSVREGQHEW